MRLLGLVGWLFTALLVRALWVYFTSPLRKVPGLFLAKITNLWRLFDVYYGSPHLTQKYLHDMYGPVVQIGPETVSLTDPNLIKTIYSTKSEYRKSHFYDVNNTQVKTSLFESPRVIENIFSTRSNLYHTRFRSLIQKHYKMTNLLNLEHILDHIINRFCIRLEQVFSDSNKTARIDEWFSYLAWDAASQLTFSQPLGFLDSGTDIEDTIKDTNQSFRYFATIGQMPFLDFWLDKNPFLRIGPPAFAHALNFTREQITKRNMNKQHDELDFLQCFLETKSAHPNVMDDEQVSTNSFMNIIGAAHSTAISLKAIMYYIHKNPRALLKLQNELDEAKLEVPVSYTSAQQLPYLNAVVKESLRMHPGIGMIMERIVPEGGLHLKNGNVIPEGTIVGMNPWVVHRNKDVFGPDAESFNPERWLQPDTEDSSVFQERISRMNSAILTFGAGKRVCLGQDFSMMEITKVTATILLKYKFEFVNPDDEWHIMGHWFMNQVKISMTVKRR